MTTYRTETDLLGSAPVPADALLNSLELLTGAARILRTHCVASLSANSERCRTHLAGATATATALLPALGYQRGGDAAREAEDTGRTIRDVVLGNGWLTPEEFGYLITPEAVTRLGTLLEGDK